MNQAGLERSWPGMASPIDAPSAKRAQTTLETVPDGLDDVAHARMDDAVFKIFEDETWNPFTLLATILESSEGGLDPKYMCNTPVKALRGNCPELADELKVVWNDGTLREIRNLSVCNPFS